MKRRNVVQRTVVSIPVSAAGRRGSRLSVVCRTGTAAARRTGRPAGGDRSFRYFVDSTGRQHFNFVQQIWLLPQVEMAVTPVLTIALETLAVNLLTLVSRRRDAPAAVGITSRRVLRLAPRFCRECLLTAHPDGWVIPRAIVQAWIASHGDGADAAVRRRRGCGRSR